MLSLPQDAVARVAAYLQELQAILCQSFAAIDQRGQFRTDAWTRLEGGGGQSCVMTEGLVFEKVGVNFSQVMGQTLPASATAHRPQLSDSPYTALGVSVVAHPDNPFVPTAHANVRFFVAEQATPLWWFGGGFDLTPYYGFSEDCEHWHSVARRACDPFGKDLYPEFKAWCDRYFYLPHRQEARGVGGLFFDDYCQQSFEHSFAFVQSIGDHFIQAYAPIVQKRHPIAYTSAHKAFQAYRRGRYVEYNLLYDRGTLFGLQSRGRTESILMSLPPVVHWNYDWHPAPGSPEEKLYTDFLPVRDWLRLEE